MRNYINTVSAFALAAFAPETETSTASNGVTLAKVGSPRILPDLTQDTSTAVGTANPEKTAKLRAARKAAEAKPAAKVGKPAAKGVAARHAANVQAASDKVRRLSRVAPVCNIIVKMMRDAATRAAKAGKASAVHVAAMAEKAECSERDVRLAIDKLRAMKWQIDNKPTGAPKTFGFRKGWKIPAKLEL